MIKIFPSQRACVLKNSLLSCIKRVQSPGRPSTIIKKKSKRRHNHGPPPTCIPEQHARAYNNKYLSALDSASETSAIRRRRRLIFPERGQLLSNQRDHRAIFQLWEKKKRKKEKKVFFTESFLVRSEFHRGECEPLMFAVGMLFLLRGYLRLEMYSLKQETKGGFFFHF